MQNVRLFPSFRPSKNASAEEKKFLEHIKKARQESGANFVNFSAYQYEGDDTRPLHFVTYPIEWITHYIQSNYLEIDPLFHLDYRRVAAIDWRDIRKSGTTARFFEDFQERGLGNHGVILTTYLETGTYGATHYCYNLDDDQWDEFRQENIDQLRLLSFQLSEAYQAIFEQSLPGKHPLTKRERQCLYWVAMGKTDDEVGELLAIGKWTVVSHLKSAKYKLGCANRASVVAKALDEGMINLKTGEV